ncbi:MAG: prepilin-type N-terminal cleavage/methylation domain-containing protein [Myxococcota bacterium]
MRSPSTAPARSRRARGFTFIEVMVAVAIVGVLASIAGSSYAKYVEKAKVARAIAEMQGIAKHLDAAVVDDGGPPASLADLAIPIPPDPWGHPYEYLQIAGNLPPGMSAIDDDGLPDVAAPPAGTGGGSGGAQGGGGGGAPAIAAARKDRFLVPINSDYDLYSRGADGLTRPQLHDADSQDDVIRGANGSYYGLAEGF